MSASLEHVQERAGLGFDAVELGPVLSEDEHTDGHAGEEGEDGGDHGLSEADADAVIYATDGDE